MLFRSYRLWRLQNGHGDLGDALEAVRNYLQGEHWDAAAGLAGALIQRLQDAGQSVSVAALASEVLERLPEEHGSFYVLADAEASAHLSLGVWQRGFERYQQMLAHFERLAKSEPERADYQMDLVVSYFKIATASTPPDRALLEKALTILLTLQEQGRLSPADQPKIAALQQLLEGLDQQS